MDIIKFIKQNKDWRDIISKEPYFINIKEDDEFILLYYSSIMSDFSIRMVRECRGIILDKNYNILCYPFDKFGNYHESYVDEIDWNTASVQEKIDGSLIKIWNYKNKWHVSTNQMIDASLAFINGKSFLDLFLFAAQKQNLNWNRLNKRNTYIFELVSPYNQVVIKYNEIKIYHIGTRNIDTLKEVDEDIGICKPKKYPFNNMNQCLIEVNKFDELHEGFVVVDENYKRIKIKSSQYIALHHAVNNHILTDERIIDIIKTSGREEFLNYFPEYEDSFKDILFNLDSLIYQYKKVLDYIRTHKFDNRKQLAEYVIPRDKTGLVFRMYDNNITNVEDYLMSLDSKKICKFIRFIKYYSKGRK